MEYPINDGFIHEVLSYEKQRLRVPLLSPSSHRHRGCIGVIMACIIAQASGLSSSMDGLGLLNGENLKRNKSCLSSLCGDSYLGVAIHGGKPMVNSG